MNRWRKEKSGKGRKKERRKKKRKEKKKKTENKEFCSERSLLLCYGTFDSVSFGFECV